MEDSDSTMYDLFCSYAHSDNDDRWVESLLKAISKTYRNLTGTDLRVFVDHETVITSDIWDRKIQAALDKSTLMVAVISPSFVRSEWSRLEWNMFATLEIEKRRMDYWTTREV
jgi:uncharacterized protein